MTKLSAQLLPSSSFTHIGVMVLFMSFIASFSALGFLFVQTMTDEWTMDIHDTMMIEIPPYSADQQTLINADEIKKLADKIKLAMDGDPAITSIKDHHVQGSELINQFDIPLPIFMTLNLHPESANNTEDRLKNKIMALSSAIIIRTQDEWQKEILSIVIRLKIIFCGLALCVFLVTGLMISAVITSQLKASKDTIELFHLMGATSGTITSLFQIALTRAVLWGLLIGIAIVFICISQLSFLYDFGFPLMDFYIAIGIIAVTFILLGWGLTRWVVMQSLWRLP